MGTSRVKEETGSEVRDGTWRRLVLELGGPLIAGLWTLSILQVALCAWMLWTPPSTAEPHSSDSVEYAVSASRLVAGQGLTVTINGVVHPTRYCFGFPLLIAPTYLLPGAGLGQAILVVWLLAVGCVHLIQRLGRQAIEGPAGLASGILNVGVLMSLGYFTHHAREIMSDVPALFLVLLALNAFVAAYRRPRAAAFLLCGAAIALAMTMRITSIAFCLPLALLALRGPRHRLKHLVASGLFPLLSLGAILLYNERVFGSPLYTGYHYWLIPVSYSLSLAPLWRNLGALLGPFEMQTQVRTAQLLMGAGAGAASLLLIATLRRRTAAWQRVKPNALFLVAGALPVSIFHLFYPFPSPRFHLALYVILFSLGSSALFVWLEDSKRRLPQAVLLAASFALLSNGGDRRQGGGYALEFMHRADPLLPADAVLISSLDGVLLDHVLGRGGAREFVPFSKRTPFARLKVGRHGEPRTAIYRFVASESPREIADLLRNGRRVFVELLLPVWTRQMESRDELERQFEFTPVMRQLGQDALAELEPARRSLED